MTERELVDSRAANEGLRNELSRLREAYDALPIGVVLVDASGTIRTSNDSARRLGGLAHADVLVQEAVDKQVLGAQRGLDSSCTVELFGPPRRVILVHALPLAEGRVLVTIEDISERARVDAVRTDFVANISHELKTPVGAIAVLAEALADDDDLPTMQRLANKMVAEAHRVGRSIDDLLELARIELGGQAVTDPVDVFTVLHEAVDRNTAAAAARDITITSSMSGSGAHPSLAVLGDRRQLVSAMGNLVDNAVKYSEQGGCVSVDATVVGDWVELTVHDRGVGIPAHDLDRIFERFYRVDRARSRDTGGTGLGLAIVRHVATNHGGEVSVTSREGEGSTFVLRLPGVGQHSLPTGRGASR